MVVDCGTGTENVAVLTPPRAAPVQAPPAKWAPTRKTEPQLPPPKHRLAICLAIAASVATYWATRTILPEMAARALSILVIATVFWATEALPLFATSFVVIGLEIVFLARSGGLADELTTFLYAMGFEVVGPTDTMSAGTFLAPFARDVIILFMGGFLLSKAITKHGLDRAIASTALRPLIRSPLALIYGVLGITAFFSMWMSNTATAAMMIAITRPIVGMLPQREKYQRGILLAVAFGANIGGIGTPIGSPPNAIAYAALNTMGYEVTFLRWMLVVTPLVLLLLSIVGLLLYCLYKPSPELKLGEVIPAEGSKRAYGTTMIILAGTALMWLTSGFHGVTPGATALLAAAALTALGVLDRKDVDSIDWDILILIWGGLSLGVALSESGFMAVIAQADLAAVSGGPWVIALLVTVAAVALSTVMSNTATAALLVPMVLAIQLPEHEQFAMLAALACSFAMAMPVSTPPNAIIFATGRIPVATFMRTGGLISMVATALLLVGYRIMLPWVF